ncbi:hypothetical protein J7E24_09205 [Hymenobacter sp. ISL-91]|uniref:heavy metal-binding domain-containing protein n=1 Tax=Hymenobacter TaxID=89966 RepID=UPI0003AACAB8|nr:MULTISPECIES: heavy metal-binding domain-containing protein [Hymenobacter]MBT2557960.1 hypothetical protein [Hymenobacter sp. ISL-91]
MLKITTWALALTCLGAATGCSENKPATTDMTPETSMSGAPAMTTDTAAMPATDMAAVTYTCPMHPEIRESGPGQCPKCKMDLVKLEAPAAQ